MAQRTNEPYLNWGAGTRLDPRAFGFPSCLGIGGVPQREFSPKQRESSVLMTKVEIGL